MDAERHAFRLRPGRRFLEERRRDGVGRMEREAELYLRAGIVFAPAAQLRLSARHDWANTLPSGANLADGCGATLQSAPDTLGCGGAQGAGVHRATRAHQRENPRGHLQSLGNQILQRSEFKMSVRVDGGGQERRLAQRNPSRIGIARREVSGAPHREDALALDHDGAIFNRRDGDGIDIACSDKREHRSTRFLLVMSGKRSVGCARLAGAQVATPTSLRRTNRARAPQVRRVIGSAARSIPNMEMRVGTGASGQTGARCVSIQTCAITCSWRRKEESEMSDASGAQPVSPAVTLDDKDMPPLFHDADQRAIRAQKFFFGWLQWELIFLGLGVLVGAFNGSLTQIGPVSLLVPPFLVAGFRITTLSAFEIAEAILLAVALSMRLIRVISRPEQLWYEARAVAESVKSIAWRYAVGGEPFQEANSPERLDAIVTDRFGGIRADLSRYKVPDRVLQQHQITLAMRTVRALPLSERKRIYRMDRVENQQGWYERKSHFNRSRAVQSHVTLIVVEVLAIFAAL